jgi:hypothetical protein
MVWLRAMATVGTLGLSACDFGTLDSLSSDEAANATDEMTTSLRGFFAKYEAGTPEELKAAAAKLPGIVQRTGGIPLQGKVGQITSEDLASIGFQARDASAVQGLLLLSEIDCPLEKVERLVVARNQTELYPKLYEKYARTFQSSAADYFARKTPTMTWKTAYSAKVGSYAYDAELLGGSRFLPNAAPNGGGLLLARTYLTAPAKFTSGGDNAAFSQDYQMEIYYETAPGRTAHVYGLWREYKAGSLTSSNDLYVSLVLGNLADFDQRTSIVCRNGTPVPDVKD